MERRRREIRDDAKPCIPLGGGARIKSAPSRTRAMLRCGERPRAIL